MGIHTYIYGTRSRSRERVRGENKQTTKGWWRGSDCGGRKEAIYMYTRHIPLRKRVYVRRRSRDVANKHDTEISSGKREAAREIFGLRARITHTHTHTHLRARAGVVTLHCENSTNSIRHNCVFHSSAAGAPRDQFMRADDIYRVFGVSVHTKADSQTISMIFAFHQPSCYVLCFDCYRIYSKTDNSKRHSRHLQLEETKNKNKKNGMRLKSKKY